MSKDGPSSKPKVLVVDDERVIADTLAIILNQSGFDASAVYTGTAAVDRAREERPDLIISDVIMPDMNGIEAAIRIRQLLPGCKILLFSGQAATADLLEKARQQGHEFEILAKPVHPQDLLAKLRG
jgi:CheY-like chemotaxis protein